MEQLPRKANFRKNELAVFFDVSERTITRWVDHGLLEAFKTGGCVRINRESVLKCMIKIEPKRIE